MASEQFSIFAFSDSQYRITKPIRLIEFFAGIGAQSKALEVLGTNFENYKIAEWSKESIKAYTYIHHYEEIKNCTDKEIINLQGISRDYNVPMTDEQLDRLKDDEKILLSNCIKKSHNLIDISSVEGEDLNIVDTDKYEYILTYSFPCQDLSLAGKLAGMKEDSGTRSSLLWQVCRILKECKNKPQILVMENVPEVVGTKNSKDFLKWCKELENMGYANYWEILNAKDYYIPQSRRRFFMVSILGKENTFAFPNRIKPKYYLLDFLDKNVDEKYYLSDKMINFFNKNSIKQKQKGNGFEFKPTTGNVVAKTITTRSGNRMDDNFILVPEATKKGYAMAEAGDGIYINRPEQKRGTVQKGMIQTIKTSCDGIGVVVLGNYSPSNHNASRIVNPKGIAPTVMENHGTVTAVAEPIDFRYDQGIRDRVDKNLCPTITTKSLGISGRPLIKYNNLRIRKLTPCECYKLMGFTQIDYERCAEIQSNATIYHQAGDSIVTTCLIAIFGKLLGVDYEKVIKNYVENEILK